MGTEGRVPRMAFVRDGLHLLDDVVKLGEPRPWPWTGACRMGAAFERYGDRVALQGNLDPAVLLAAPVRGDPSAPEALLETSWPAGPATSWRLGHGVHEADRPRVRGGLRASGAGSVRGEPPTSAAPEVSK